jgi:outer membrane protein TolC
LIRREFDHKVRTEKLFGEISIRGVVLPRLEEVLAVQEVPRLDAKLAPNLIAIRAEAESAKAAVKTVSAQNYPSINWVIQKSTQKDVLDRDTPMYTAITFSLDLFKGFGISNAERSAASRASGAQSRYDHAQREFSVQLRSWGAQIGMLDSQVKKLSVIENDAFRLLEVAYRRYELARAAHSELIDAELSYYSARISHANSLAERDQLHLRIITESGLHRQLIGTQ